ncbi:MAG TPA: serine/threonine-protein kinase, partial [Thermoanaerobaculia bacterium]|nr:serine/threonine-protein kinase [Thermoanaerobaculia bacterium]
MPLAAGTRLGPFEVVAPLGAGGMGEVYRARDERLARDVAVKVLPARVAENAEAAARFAREARAASALNHPNIVVVHDVGRSGDVSWVAMELVEGSSLRQLLSAGRPPLRRALQIAAEVADGLAAAHEKGIVHRDLKPENVMVRPDGRAKILDFGLAKSAPAAAGAEDETVRANEGTTAAGMVLGTPAYMSPEQASGRPVDFRSDQFSFGSVLYEVVTGRRAFRRDTLPETLAAIVRDEPEPAAEVDPSLPLPVLWVLERCLAKEPSDRYASTRDLARDLAHLAEHLPSISGRSAVAPEALSPARRRRSLPALLALAGLVLVAAGVFAGRRLV